MPEDAPVGGHDREAKLPVADRCPAPAGPAGAERAVAILGGALLAALAVAAAALWLRYGEIVYLARIIAQMPNCL